MDQHFVTIVSGLPRSGTSLMMQILAAGGMPILTDGQRVADPDNLRGYFEFEAVKETKRNPAWLTDAVGRAVKMVHVLLYDLPAGYSYRVILMKRKLEEVLASQRVMLDRQGKKGANLSPAQLAVIYQKQLSQLEDWLSKQDHFRALTVSYNDLVAEPREPVQAINEFLDGGLDVEAMCRVVEPGLYRQRGERNSQ
jgi:hypothetical protein